MRVELNGRPHGDVTTLLPRALRSDSLVTMKRAALLTAVLLAACGDDGSFGSPDAGNDQQGFGSGSGAMAGVDPSPPDVALEWMVIALSVIVIGGSVRSRRRAAKTFEL